MHQNKAIKILYLHSSEARRADISSTRQILTFSRKFLYNNSL